MEESYIYNALLRFAYHEMPAEEAVDMADLIGEYPEMQAAFHDMLIAKALLPKVQFSPSATTINTILQYSTKTAFEAHL